ncbi:MAG TPA: PQQ-dependent sugar dehydrogenase [Thermoanaerobaculia bacterium]|nr:PQQ-dependent sugar dehydrogenase [Thermoanaerobaculia bacterium]
MRPPSPVARRILSALLGLAITAPARAVTLPPGFGDSLVATVGAPTALAFTPDGRLLIATQGGTLRVVQGGVLLPTPALSLGSAVCSNGERGLLGVAVDPQFTTNHFIYLFYTFNKNALGCPSLNTTTPVERISRFTLDVPTANVIDPATQLVLLDNVLNFAGNHNGGQLRVGPDGYLYAGIGDGGCDYAGDSGCAGANDASRDRNILNGKILRIARDGSVPPTNPFLGAGTARCNVGPSAPGTICQETFLWGLRNPFRFAFRPSDNALFVNDVGEGSFEEIDLAQAGGDYGWPCREGAHTALTTNHCSPTPPNMLDPFFEYPHGTIPGTSTTGCGSITGGAWVPAGAWPSVYDGTYLFADFNCGAIARLTPGAPSTASDFATGLGLQSVVELLFGPSPTGTSLYYTTYAAGGQVRRIDFAAPPPAATFRTLTPCRAIDTRRANGPTGGPALQANLARTFPIAGACGVPPAAVAVAANVTVTGSSAAGSLRIGPAGTTPSLDTLPFPAGSTKADNAVLGLFGTPAGSVTVVSGFASGTVHLVVDVTGYWQ